MTSHTRRSAAYRSAAVGGTEPADDWRDRAACRDEPTDLFFPTGTSGPAEMQINHAKAICFGGCPVRRVCRDWAVNTGQDFGIWGGQTEQERRAYARHGIKSGRAS